VGDLFSFFLMFLAFLLVARAFSFSNADLSFQSESLFLSI